MELWKTDILESIAAQLGWLLKIDENTLQTSRAKYARLCLEIDLSLPLKQGIWVGFGSREVLITFQYERLPVFCFHCGMIGHNSSSCPSLPSSSSLSEAQHHDIVSSETGLDEQPIAMDVVGQGASASCGPFPIDKESAPPSVSSEESFDKFGPWMVVQRRRGRGSGNPSSAHPRPLSLPSEGVPRSSGPLHASHVPAPLAFSSSRGRGGKRGGRGSFDFGGRGGRGVRSDIGPSDPYLDPLLAPDRWIHSSASELALPEEPLNPLSLVPRSACFGASPLGPVTQSIPSVIALPKPPLPLPLTPFSKEDSSPSSFSFPPSSLVPPLCSADSFSRSAVPFASPLLLTSEAQTLPLQRPPLPESEAHLALVSRVVQALTPSPDPPCPKAVPIPDSMEEELLSESSEEGDVDMNLDQPQRNTKIEAIARRDNIKVGSSRKKGRKTLIS